jgi:hypothetical protein
MQRFHGLEPDKLSADQPWEKQGLLCGRIEHAGHDRLAGSITGRRRETITRQRLEPALGLQEGFRVVGIEAVPGIAVVVHDDLGCHRYAPDVGRQIKAKLLMLDVGKSSAQLIQVGSTARQINRRNFGRAQKNVDVKSHRVCSVFEQQPGRTVAQCLDFSR